MLHDNLRPFQCPTCNATFQMKTHLTAHVSTVHEKRKPYVCEVCGLTFGLKWNRNNHVRRVHEKITPFACTVPGCECSFAQKYDLQRYVPNESSSNWSLPHQKEVRTDIPACRGYWLRFVFSCVMVWQCFRHIRLVHSSKDERKCPKCRASFRTAAEFDRHFQQHHRDADPGSSSGHQNPRRSQWNAKLQMCSIPAWSQLENVLLFFDFSTQQPMLPLSCTGSPFLTKRLCNSWCWKVSVMLWSMTRSILLA